MRLLSGGASIRRDCAPLRSAAPKSHSVNIIPAMADTQNNTLRGKGVMPTLTVDDLGQSLKFFGALGFEIQDRWEFEGVLVGAMIKGGDARFGLTQDDGKKGRDRVKGLGLRIYIETADDIDAVAARVEAAGVTLTRKPYDTEWGARAFEVKEPSGFALTIVSRTSLT